MRLASCTTVEDFQLTQHFWLREATHSDTALRDGIDNTPRPAEFATILWFAHNYLQPIRDYFRSPVRVSSWFRCDALNAAVGGAEKSWHRFGCAADIVVENRDLHSVAAWVLSHSDTVYGRGGNLAFTEMALERLEGRHWVHLAASPWVDVQPNEVLTIDDDTGTKRTRSGLHMRSA